MTSRFKRMLGFGTSLEKERDKLAKEIKSTPDKEERKKLLETTKAERIKITSLYNRFKEFLNSKPKFNKENEQKLFAILSALFKTDEEKSYWAIEKIINDLNYDSENPEFKNFLNENLIDLFIQNRRGRFILVYRHSFKIPDEIELCKKLIANKQTLPVFEFLYELSKDKPKEFQEEIINETIKNEEYAVLIYNYYRFEEGLIDLKDIFQKFLDLNKDPAEINQVLEVVLNMRLKDKIKQETLVELIKKGYIHILSSYPLQYTFSITNPKEVLEEVINSSQKADYNKLFLGNPTTFLSIRDLDISYAIKLIEQNEEELVFTHKYFFRGLNKSEDIDLVFTECISKSKFEKVKEYFITFENIPSKYIKIFIDSDPEFLIKILDYIKCFKIENLADEEYLVELVLKKDHSFILKNLDKFKFYKFQKDIALKIISDGLFLLLYEKLEHFEEFDDEVALALLDKKQFLFFQTKFKHFKNLSEKIYQKLKEEFGTTDKKTGYKIFIENSLSFNESLHVEMGEDLIDVGLWEELLQNLEKYHDPDFKLQRKLIEEKLGLEEVFANLDLYGKFNQALLVRLALFSNSENLIFSNITSLKEISHSQIVSQFIYFSHLEELEKGFGVFRNLDIEVVVKLVKIGKLDLILENISKFKKETHNRIAYECLMDGRTVELFEKHLNKLTNLDIIYLVNQMKILDQMFILTSYMHLFPRSIQEEISKML